MKDKRITMKDVAKEAGVSTATVSYVLNYSDTERISHETRLRVFEAANKLNYVPNMAAKALSEKKSYLVGMIINKRARSKKSKIYQYYDLADEIRVILHALGYDMFLISAEEIEEGVSIGIRRTLDAVFIVDLEESLFKKIANKFFVPAIFIDGYVADPLFCKVLVDSKELLDKAQEILGEEFYVVLEDYFNDYLLEYIRKRGTADISITKNGQEVAGMGIERPEHMDGASKTGAEPGKRGELKTVLGSGIYTIRVEAGEYGGVIACSLLRKEQSDMP